MAKVPFPCCCAAGPSGCGDYYSPNVWRFDLDNFVNTAFSSYADATQLPGGNYWYYWTALGSGATLLNGVYAEWSFVLGDLGSVSGGIKHTKLIDGLSIGPLTASFWLAGSDALGAKPDNSRFVENVVRFENFAAVVEVEEISRSRRADLSLWCNVSGDALTNVRIAGPPETWIPFDVGNFGPLPGQTYPFSELNGKVPIGDFREGAQVINCGLPLALRWQIIPSIGENLRLRFSGSLNDVVLPWTVPGVINATPQTGSVSRV